MAKEMREVKYAGQQFRIKGDFGQVLCRRRDKSTITQWCGKPRREKVLPKFMFLPKKDMSRWDGKFDSLLTREDVADYLKVEYLSPEVDIFIRDNIIDENEVLLSATRNKVNELVSDVEVLKLKMSTAEEKQKKMELENWVAEGIMALAGLSYLISLISNAFH